jgi:glutathione S-transferase
MTDLKVTYYDFSGSRGEEVRLALTLANVEFVDNRITREAFGAIKAELPNAALPTLEVAGKGVFGQSNAILRLIGRQHGLYPTDLFEAARHDALMDGVEDLRHRLSPTLRMQDPAQRKVAREQIVSDYFPLWGKGIERLIGAGPFVGGQKPGVADTKVFVVNNWISSGTLDDVPAASFDAFPAIKRLVAAFRSLPAVTEWYARPH